MKSKFNSDKSSQCEIFSSILADAKAQNKITRALVNFVVSFAKNYCSSQNIDPDDFTSAVLLRLDRNFHKISSQKNPLAYLGSMFYWEKKSYFRKLKKRHDLIIYESELAPKFGRSQSIEECKA